MEKDTATILRFYLTRVSHRAPSTLCYNAIVFALSFPRFIAVKISFDYYHIIVGSRPMLYKRR